MSVHSNAGILAAPAAAGALEHARPWLAPVLLVALVIFHLGYFYGGANYQLLYPWIARRIDPSLLARDWFGNTMPHHLNFVRILAWLAPVAPLPLVVLVWHVLSLFLLLWVAHRFVGRLFGDERVLYAALFLFLRWGADGLGGNGLLANYFLPHYAAAPLCLLAFYLAFLEKPLAAGMVAAAATWIHIQLGALTMLVLGAGMLFRWRRYGWRRILLTGLLYLAAILPTLAPQWRLYVTAPSPLLPREFLYIHAILRQPHHLIPSSWLGSDYYHFFLVLGIGALAFERQRSSHRQILTWCAIILALGVAGYVFVELAPVKAIIKLQLFRMTIFVKFFAVLFAARFLIQVLEKEPWPQKACAAAILAIQNFAVIGACMALLVALRQNRRWLWGLCIFAAGCVTGVTIVATASLGMQIPMFFHSFAVAPRGVWVGLASLAALAALARRHARLVPVSLLGLAVVLRIITGMAYFGYDHPPADEWYRFCQQIKASAPRDALFVTPPVLGGFTMFAERAEVADFKNTPSIETDLVEWKRRMDDLMGGTLRCSGWVECGSVLAGGYYRLRERDFLHLARKYGAQYVVTAQAGHRLDFPEVLRLGDYTLYRLPL